MTRLVVVLLSAWFVLTAWSEGIADFGGTSLIKSSRSADPQSFMAKSVKGEQQRNPHPNPLSSKWNTAYLAAQLQSPHLAIQPKQFLDPTAPQYPTGILPVSVVVADFNGDGKADLAVTRRDDKLVSVLIANTDGTLQTHVDYATSDVPVGVAVGDFNGDGTLDLVVANANLPPYPPPLSILLGNGDGTFQTQVVDYVTENGSMSVAVGDFNGDGRSDLAVTVSTSMNVMLSNGDGTFQTHVYSMGNTADSVVVGDFNGDGKADVAVNSGGVRVLLGNGDGTFQAPVDYSGVSGVLAISDFNGDGKADVAATSANSLSVLLGNGDGTFQTPLDNPEIGVVRPAFGDLNGDGKADMVESLAGYGVNLVRVQLGNGDGTFKTLGDYPTGNYPLAVAIGDCNGDGKADLVVANEVDNSVSVLPGNGDGTFPTLPIIAMGNSAVGSIGVGDFNGDGRADLAVARASENGVAVVLANANGTFRTATEYATGNGPWAVAVGDFNGDGKSDLAVMNANSVSVLIGNGNGTFQAHTDSAITDSGVMAVGDFNRDGKDDLAVVAGGLIILLGNGDGTLQREVNYATGQDIVTGVAVGDFNGDGNPDVVVTNYSLPNLIGIHMVSVLLGNGDGAFKKPLQTPSSFYPLSVAVGDFNGDGKADVAVGDPVSANVMVGNGDGTFQAPVNYGLGDNIQPGSTTVAIGDFNGDGIPDLALTNNYVNVLSVLMGNGDGTFQAAIDYARGQGKSSVTVGDFNGDGAPDLAFLTPALPDMPLGTLKSNLSFLLNTGVKAKGFAVSATPGSATFKSGFSTDFSVTSTAMNGFEGSVSLTCSVSPTPALAPTCTLNPQSVGIPLNASATAKLTVTTTVPTASLHPVSPFDSRLWSVLSPVFGLALIGAGSRRWNKKRIVSSVLLALTITSLSLLACGGGSSSGGGTGTRGTPAGQYHVTVTAKYGSVAHSSEVTITVQ